MAHPIIELQKTFVLALKNDAQLIALLGSDAVFDAPPKGRKPPFVVFSRHDVFSRDGDDAVINEHRLLVHCWHEEASRKAVLSIVERVVFVALNADLSGADLIVSHAHHERTDSAIDGKTGRARAIVAFRFFSEPVV